MSLKDMLLEGRQCLEWYNQVIGKNDDYNLYYTSFDDKAMRDVDGGRWIWKFNRRVLVLPDGSLLGVPKVLQKKESRAAVLRRSLYRDPPGTRATAEKLYKDFQVEINWGGVAALKKFLSKKGNEELNQFVQEKLGKAWEQKMTEAIMRQRVLDGVFPSRLGSTVVSATPSELKALDSLLKEGGYMKEQLVEVFGPQWPSVLQHYKSKNVYLTDPEDESNSPLEQKLFDIATPYVEDVHARYPIAIKKAPIKALRQLLKVAGDVPNLRQILISNPKLDKVVNAVFEERKGDVYRGVISQLKATEEKKMLRLFDDVPSGHIFSNTSLQKSFVKALRESDVIGGENALLQAMTESEPFRQKVAKAMGAHPNTEMSMLRAPITGGASMLDAAAAGRDVWLAHRRNREREVTYSKRLPEAYYQKRLRSIQDEIEEKASEAYDLEEVMEDIYAELTSRADRTTTYPHSITMEYMGEECKKVVQEGLDLLGSLIPPKVWGPPISERAVNDTFGHQRSFTLILRDTSDRAYCSSTGTQAHIDMGGSKRKSVFMHEMGHYLEASNGRVADAATYFLKSRMEGESAVSLKKAGNAGYGDAEICIEDNLLSPYMGKLYSESRASEVISMGLQMFETPATMAQLQYKDPEYFAMMLALLRGNFGFRE